MDTGTVPKKWHLNKPNDFYTPLNFDNTKNALKIATSLIIQAPEKSSATNKSQIEKVQFLD